VHLGGRALSVRESGPRSRYIPYEATAPRDRLVLDAQRRQLLALQPDPRLRGVGVTTSAPYRWRACCSPRQHWPPYSEAARLFGRLCRVDRYRPARSERLAQME
jgi:hypothetical protein